MRHSSGRFPEAVRDAGRAYRSGHAHGQGLAEGRSRRTVICNQPPAVGCRPRVAGNNKKYMWSYCDRRVNAFCAPQVCRSDMVIGSTWRHIRCADCAHKGRLGPFSVSPSQPHMRAQGRNKTSNNNVNTRHVASSCLGQQCKSRRIPQANFPNVALQEKRSLALTKCHMP